MVLVLGGVVVMCLLIVALCIGEPCVVFFFGSGDFGACCCFPFVHGARDFVSIQHFAVDTLAQAFPEAYDSSFGVECPASSKCQPFKGGDVSVDVPSRHGEFHKLVICILFLGGVRPSVLKRHFELCPEYLIVFTYMVRMGGVSACH